MEAKHLLSLESPKKSPEGVKYVALQAARMRAPVSTVAQNPDGKLIIEIVAAFKLEDCLIAASFLKLNIAH